VTYSSEVQQPARPNPDVRVVQNPLLSLEGDVAATRQIIDEQPGPVVLVGHSYGGAVITEAGRHEKVAALGYIAAYASRRLSGASGLRPA